MMPGGDERGIDCGQDLLSTADSVGAHRREWKGDVQDRKCHGGISEW